MFPQDQSFQMQEDVAHQSKSPKIVITDESRKRHELRHETVILEKYEKMARR